MTRPVTSVMMCAGLETTAVMLAPSGGQSPAHLNRELMDGHVHHSNDDKRAIPHMLKTRRRMPPMIIENKGSCTITNNNNNGKLLQIPVINYLKTVVRAIASNHNFKKLEIKI